MASDLRMFLRALDRGELEQCAGWFDEPYSGRDMSELIDSLTRRLGYDVLPLVDGNGPFYLEQVNRIAERLGGVRRASLRDAVDEVIERSELGDQLDHEEYVESVKERGKKGLQQILRQPSIRTDALRDYLRGLHAVDRELFFRLARNRPGPGASISDPERNGFVRINGASPDELDRLIERASGYDNPERVFEEGIALTHRLRTNFRVYVGRTYLRAGDRHAGLRSRWESHYVNKQVTYGTVLALVPRSKIERAELMAIRLTKLWEEYDTLCCNNDVMGRAGNLSEDPRQLIYMCIARR